MVSLWIYFKILIRYKTRERCQVHLVRHDTKHATTHSDYSRKSWRQTLSSADALCLGDKSISIQCFLLTQISVCVYFKLPQSNLNYGQLVVRLGLIIMNMYFYMNRSMLHNEELRTQKTLFHCLSDISTDSKCGLYGGFSKLNVKQSLDSTLFQFHFKI